MIKTTRKSLISILIALLLLCSLSAGLMTSAFAVTQAQIDDLKEKRNEINAQKVQMQDKVDELYAQQADVMEQKKALDERNAFTIEQIKLNEEEMALYDEMIEEEAKKVEAALALEQEQLERYRVRVRAMEENGSYNILALILKSNNLGELLTIIDDVGEIMKSDRALEDAYIEARQNTEAVKAEYEAVKTELEAREAELQAEQEQLEAELEEATNLIEQLQSDINSNSEALEKLKAEQEETDAKINSMIAELEEQRRQEMIANAPGNSGGNYAGGTVTGTGNFAWPVGSTYITSCVGYRYHPITGAWKYHSGMDIGASYGSTVYASDTGTVSLSGWNGGYGECIIIDHGNGYYTLYAHLSSRAVDVGQELSQGSVIGYVGSTGNSTGPHLHFEIREGTNPIDFTSWFSGLTFAPDSGGA